MKMLTLAFVLLLFSAPAQAASLLGDWAGTGSTTMEPGTAKAHSRACSEIAMTLQQKGSQITMSGEYACEDMQATYDPSTFDIQGSDLYFEGQKVGTLSDTTFALDYLDPEDGSTFRLTLSVTDKGLSYREEWLEGGVSEMLTLGFLSLR